LLSVHCVGGRGGKISSVYSSLQVRTLALKSDKIFSKMLFRKILFM
jgi:hypothetical protein